jgi:hypothetical protein
MSSISSRHGLHGYADSGARQGRLFRHLHGDRPKTIQVHDPEIKAEQCEQGEQPDHCYLADLSEHCWAILRPRTRFAAPLALARTGNTQVVLVDTLKHGPLGIWMCVH